MTGFTFFSYAPRPTLAPFVEMIWGVRGSAEFHSEAVLPGGSMELMVNLGPPQRISAYGDRDVEEWYTHAWVAGIQDQRLVHTSSHANHIAVRFRPGGAHAFFGLPMDALANRVIELDQVIGPAAAGLRDRVLEQPDDPGRSGALQSWLMERRMAVHPYFATVRRAVDLLRSRSFRGGVAQVCDSLGLSNRHLVKQFRESVGLTPKTLGRIARFQGVIADCQGRQDVAWSRLAMRHGYADQAHLIREFRVLGSVTPLQFLLHRTPDETAVIVPDPA